MLDALARQLTAHEGIWATRLETLCEDTRVAVKAKIRAKDNCMVIDVDVVVFFGLFVRYFLLVVFCLNWTTFSAVCKRMSGYSKGMREYAGEEKK